MYAAQEPPWGSDSDNNISDYSHGKWLDIEACLRWLGRETSPIEAAAAPYNSLSGAVYHAREATTHTKTHYKSLLGEENRRECLLSLWKMVTQGEGGEGSVTQFLWIPPHMSIWAYIATPHMHIDYMIMLHTDYVGRKALEWL